MSSKYEAKPYDLEYLWQGLKRRGIRRMQEDSRVRRPHLDFMTILRWSWT